MDVKTTFLNSDLKENVYMKLPKGFAVKGKEYANSSSPCMALNKLLTHNVKSILSIFRRLILSTLILMMQLYLLRELGKLMYILWYI